MLVNSSSWDIDTSSGHLAHSSGLHAYIAGPPTESGALRCVGPFSSFKNRMKRDDVYTLTAAAIREIEEIDIFKGCFTYWGSITNVRHQTGHTVKILNEKFKFIPNPCFRTDILLRSFSSHFDPADLSLEWTESECLTQIQHNMGSSFTFPLHEQRLTAVVGHVESVAEDLAVLDPRFSALMIKALGAVAVTVLNRFGASVSNPTLKRLKLNIRESLPLAS